jgi:hypothetical protein
MTTRRSVHSDGPASGPHTSGGAWGERQGDDEAGGSSQHGREGRDVSSQCKREGRDVSSQHGREGRDVSSQYGRKKRNASSQYGREGRDVSSQYGRKKRNAPSQYGREEGRRGGGGSGKERHPAPPEVVDQLEPHVEPEEPHGRLGRRARRARRRRRGRRRRRALPSSGVDLHGARAESVLHRGPDAPREACVFECDLRTSRLVRGEGRGVSD